jgi:hypothetical protein
MAVQPQSDPSAAEPHGLAPAAVADRLCDTLHRQLAASEHPAHCWVLFDPSPLGMQEPDDTSLSALLANPAVRQVKPANTSVAEPFAAKLLPVDAARYEGSELLRSSLLAALHETPSKRLVQGHGRIVAAWLECEGEPGDVERSLVAHIAHTMFARRPNGRLHWLRWYDPAVLWLLWPRLDARQQHYLLGPVRRCWLLTPSAELACLQAPQPPEAEPLTALGLTDAQWAVIDAISALNLALAQADASSLDAATLQRVADTGMSAITRAQQAGWSDRQDLALYARLAITRHAHFDRHPSVSQRLQAARPGDFFSAAINGITEDEWHHIKRDLDDATATTITSSRALRP